MEPKVMIWGGLQENQTPRTDEICPTINAAAGMGGGQTPVITEPQVMTTKRTEHGKVVRKDYESGKVRESRKSIQRLEPRNDGISNTITTVQKDNLVAEPTMLMPQREYDENGNRSVKHTETDLSPSILATQYKSGDNQPKTVEPSGMYVGCPQYLDKKPLAGVARAIMTDTKNAVALSSGRARNRIRKLTPKECFMLMDFDAEDFDKASAAGVSNSQLYKQAGNSICVGVLVAIFKQMIRR